MAAAKAISAIVVCLLMNIAAWPTPPLQSIHFPIGLPSLITTIALLGLNQLPPVPALLPLLPICIVPLGQSNSGPVPVPVHFQSQSKSSPASPRRASAQVPAVMSALVDCPDEPSLLLLLLLLLLPQVAALTLTLTLSLSHTHHVDNHHIHYYTHTHRTTLLHLDTIDDPS